MLQANSHIDICVIKDLLIEISSAQQMHGVAAEGLIRWRIKHNLYKELATVAHGIAHNALIVSREASEFI